MLVSEIATRVKRQFGDEAGAQITDADIIRWVNDAMREIAVANDLLQTTAKTAVAVGIDQYSVPPDVLNLNSVRYNGQKLKFLSQQEASDFLLEGTTKVKGTPTHYALWGLKLDLYPAPDTAITDALQLYYTRQPAIITLVTETPELPQQYHNRIVEYCLAQAHELDDNPESYQMKMNMFQSGVDRMKGMDRGEQDTYGGISVSRADTGMGEIVYYD